ncbi:MAG: UvrD-helicase domain-containing protein, partial [Desulfobacteraceae bacterium]
MSSAHCWTMKTAELDILQAPLLPGISLIEASAGTGKTYTLTALYIRLLLEQGLPVESILAVTFTEAATSELKGRIRALLREAMSAFSGRGTKEEFLQELAARAPDRDQALLRLKQGLQDLDQAGVFTIHGFCRRVLSEHAFESGAPFETELVTDQEPFVRTMVDDFWRRHLYGASPLFVRYALGKGFTPDALRRLLDSGPGLLSARV